MFILRQTTHRMVIRHDPRIGHLWVRNQVARIPHERGGYLVRTNAQGFRSDVDFAPRRGDRPRLLFFGDSMTAGDGCNNPERFSEQVGRILGAEVYNYGLSGSGTDQHLLIFEEFAKDVEADAIVLCIAAHNTERVLSTHRPIVDRATHKRVLVPKPYFDFAPDGALELHQVPVPLERPEESEETAGVLPPSSRDVNPGLRWAYALGDRVRGSARLGRLLSPETVDEMTPLRSFLKRHSGFDPHPEFRDPGSRGARLMAAIVERFVAGASPIPVLIVPIPIRGYFLDGLHPGYQEFFERFDDPGAGVHVGDVTTPLQKLPFAERRRISFPRDSHFSPHGHRLVAEHIAHTLRERGLVPEPTAAREPESPSRPVAGPAPRYVLGVSCFYHNSAASLVKDGEIVAASEEERFSRVKHDRRFPSHAVNFCLEQAEIDVSDLDAVVYYDNTQLTFERLLHTAAAVEDEGRDLWQSMMPSWARYKLNLPTLIRRYLHYDGPVLQDLHHRSHAASAFFPSPFESAAILTIDGVGEWATACIGLGRGSEIEILKEMNFPNSLGLLYSAFTQFLGFKVNDGEYKMMGLAPYGRPVYVDAILEHLVSLKEDGTIELHMDRFAFLSQPTMTNERFAEVLGGPARESESPITQREMDLARSVQHVTEEAMLRMAREAHRLTGEERLCMSGGVVLNCVANGRLLREGPFADLWMQPASGDSGSALGAALDAYHTQLGMPRVLREDGRPLQGGSFLGAEFSDDEVQAFLETHGYPYRKLAPEERADVIAELLESGKVVGHMAGRGEFGPRALGSRSILGDPRNEEMQVTINLKIKYRESFRPFAPVVLAHRVSDYFELDRESPYMLLVAPVRAERRLPFERGEGEDMLEIVRKPRSDIPAITHIDYSARIQTVRREDHSLYYDVLEAFEKRTGCAVLVNTSFNVRGEPIVNTPQDAYRCFMGTEMDVLVMQNCILYKDDQPPSNERKGHMEDLEVATAPIEPDFLSALTAVFEEDFLPRARALNKRSPSRVIRRPGERSSAWEDFRGATSPKEIFSYPPALLHADASAAELAHAITAGFSDPDAAAAFRPVVERVIEVGRRFADESELSEEVPESVYVMF